MQATAANDVVQTDLVRVEVLAAVLAAKRRHGNGCERQDILSSIDEVRHGRLEALGVVGAPDALHEAPEVGERCDERALHLAQPHGNTWHRAGVGP